MVMTLGFEPGPLISAIASCAAEGLSEGAEVIVFTAGFPDERAERAWRQLQNVIGMMDLTKRLDVKLERHRVPLEDFTEAVRTIKDRLVGIKDRRVRIALTGGMRALGLAVFVAYLLIDWTSEPRLEVYLEGRGMALSVPEVRRLIGRSITPERVSLLRTMKPGRVYRPSDLSGLVGKDRSTIYRHLQALLRTGLVERVDNGYRLSKLGLLLV